MLQALFYKEWIKTRRIVLLILLLCAAFCTYAFINLGQAFRLGGAVAVWADALLKDAMPLPAATQWLPVLAGVLLGVAQFVPEMEHKRLKLTLHLPLGESRTLSIMLAYGLAVLAALFAAVYACLLAGLCARFPQEMVAGAVWKTLPWFLSGLAGYLFAAWTCLEPSWRQRIVASLAGVCCLAFFHMTALSGAYRPSMVYLVALCIAGFLLPFHATARFKDGVQ